MAKMRYAAVAAISIIFAAVLWRCAAGAASETPVAGTPRPAIGKKASMAVLGVYTPMRFKRGDLDDYIPDEWNLEFFSKERTGLDRLMSGLFYGLLNEESEDMDIVDPQTFERVTHNVYRKVYSTFLNDAAQRFHWDKVYDFCKMLNIRYALFGDVTKLDIGGKKNAVTLEMYVYIYDFNSQSVTYSQLLKNDGKLAEAYSYNSLRRLHKGVSPDTLTFMTTDIGRAATVVFDTFLTGLESGVGVVPPASGTVPTGGTATGTVPIIDLTQGTIEPRTEFASAYQCKSGGDVLVLSSESGTAMLACDKVSFKVMQNAGNPPDFTRGAPRPVLGEFEVRGRPMLALASPAGMDFDAEIFTARGAKFDLDSSLYQLSGVFGGNTGGVFAAAGDFDGDKKDDLALCDDAGTVAVYKLKAGKPVKLDSFDSPFTRTGGGAFPAAGDFNGAGTKELLLTGAGGGNKAAIFKPAAGGVFSGGAPTETIRDIFANYSGGVFAAAGDFDGDGVDEMAFTKADENSDVVIFKYKRGRYFAVDEVNDVIPKYVGGVFPAAGDFDGDGNKELALATTDKTAKVVIYKFKSGKLDIENPMAQIDSVFAQEPNGLFITAGKFAAMWQR